MSRLTIFASYDKQGIVHDYVISYLKRLKRVSDKIIFIADNHAKDKEKQKLKGLVEFCSFAPHGEYDFGSYKRGYQYAMQQGLLETVDELILCNDSCFCVMDFNDIFSKMNEKKCDFWGLSENKSPLRHLQSYFLVFKKNVFKNKEFSNWIEAVKRQDNSYNVIKSYEIPLTYFLEDIGFKSDAFIKYQEKTNPTVKPLTLIKQHMPLIKRKCFTSREACEESVRQLLVILNTRYNDTYNDICNYFKLSWNRVFPIILPRYFDTFRCFLYLMRRFFIRKKLLNREN